MKILVVDDDERLLCLMVEFLMMHHRVVTAIDGEEGWRCFERENPDVVVTDLSMPRLDGFGLIKGIRRSGRGVPIVLITGQRADDEAVIAASAMADVVLHKPFSMMALLEVVDSFAEGVEKRMAE